MSSGDVPPRWLTVDQVATQTQVNAETVRRWLREFIESGGRSGLRGMRFSKRIGWRIAQDDLVQFMVGHFPQLKEETPAQAVVEELV